MILESTNVCKERPNFNLIETLYSIIYKLNCPDNFFP